MISEREPINSSNRLKLGSKSLHLSVSLGLFKLTMAILLLCRLAYWNEKGRDFLVYRRRFHGKMMKKAEEFAFGRILRFFLYFSFAWKSKFRQKEKHYWIFMLIESWKICKKVSKESFHNLSFDGKTKRNFSIEISDLGASKRVRMVSKRNGFLTRSSEI